jgi:hypothetical protein
MPEIIYPKLILINIKPNEPLLRKYSRFFKDLDLNGA